MRARFVNGVLLLTFRAFCRLEREEVMAEVSLLNLSISWTRTVFMLSP